MTIQEDNEDRIKLTRYLSIYRQKNRSKKWQIYFWDETKNKPYKRSTRTADLDEAKLIAFETFGGYRQRELTNFDSSTKTNVGTICREILSHFDREEKTGTLAQKKYLIRENRRRRKYLELLKQNFDNTSISKFNYQKLFAFYEQFQKKISKTELSYVNQSVKAVFSYALRHGFIDHIPQIPSVKYRVKEEKTSISDHDYKKLKHHLSTRKRRQGNDRETNLILQFCLSVLRNTGIRPGKELSEIQCQDIILKTINQQKIWVLKIKGGKVATKDNIKREIVVTHQTVTCLYYALSIAHPNIPLTLDRDEIQQQLKLHPKKYMFRTSKGKFPDLSKLMATAISEIEHEIENINVIPYSLRHSYINHHLLKKELNIATLAKHCGTSIEMINDYYNHLSSQLSADYFMKEENILFDKNSIELLRNELTTYGLIK